jgi:hypothetical protein
MGELSEKVGFAVPEYGDYTVISGTDAYDLAKKVCAMKNEGWSTVGGVAIDGHFFQAMENRK